MGNWVTSWKTYLKEQIEPKLELENYTLNTSNHNKFREFCEYGLQGVHRTEIDLPEPNSDPITVVAYKASSVPPKTIIEDTSLDVEGAEIGVNVRWMLDRLDKFVGKKAVITTLLAVLEDDGKVYIYEGKLTGKIVNPSGGGFGFDSVFLPDGSNKTLGEEKPKHISARYKAVQNFLNRRVHDIVSPIENWDGEMQHT
jgi:inosine/xanthosine triphosphate pyrophosphatase family protein